MLDSFRHGRSQHENHLIDGLVRGAISRRDFPRFGTVLGLSAPVLGGIAGAAGYGLSPTSARASSPGGTIRFGLIVPAGAINPVTVADGGGVTVLSQFGEACVLSGPDLSAALLPAESWSPNADGTVWTFKLRQNVKFHDGKPMTADDVVATFDRLADPAVGSNALSGKLSKGGTRKADDHTVEFHLDASSGNFPYAVSTDNYNAVIVPAEMPEDFEATMIGTGPFKLEKYTPKVGASFVRNPDYWRTPPLPDRIEITFYDDYQPQILALQAGEIDIVQQIPVLQAVGLLSNPGVNTISTQSSVHCQVHMRTDMEPFKDKRVRQAIALCLDRPKLIPGLLKGKAQIGNDSLFMPIYPSTDTSVAQRQIDIAQAKQLMEAAGMASGFKTTLTNEKFLEIQEYAVLIQNAVKEIGGDIALNIMDQGARCGDAVPGKSPWLDSEMGITDFGHRGVPNVFLQAPLASTGTWNAAHFANPQYDTLVHGYIAALDLETQRTTAGEIQTLLLDETPVIFSSFLRLPDRHETGGYRPGADGDGSSDARPGKPVTHQFFRVAVPCGPTISPRETHDFQIHPQTHTPGSLDPVALERADLCRRPPSAGQRRARDAGALCRSGRRRCAQSRNGHGPAFAGAICRLDLRVPDRRSRDVLCLSLSGRAIPGNGAVELGQTCGGRVRAGRAAGDFRRCHRGTLPGSPDGPHPVGGRAFGYGSTGVCLRHPADPYLRGRPAMVPDLGQLARRRGSA
ncbi:MAG: ABC transporter substrate-binding protein [Rhodobacterales bacterium]|nr:ABC transporter substrate-binding protein [Rhodobacterales bacterium]